MRRKYDERYDTVCLRTHSNGNQIHHTAALQSTAMRARILGSTRRPEINRKRDYLRITRELKLFFRLLTLKWGSHFRPPCAATSAPSVNYNQLQHSNSLSLLVTFSDLTLNIVGLRRHLVGGLPVRVSRPRQLSIPSPRGLCQQQRRLAY